MPLFNDKCLVRARKFLRTRQLSDLQTDGFTKFNHRIDVEHRFARAVANVNVNGSVLIAVEETVTVLLENFGRFGVTAVAVPSLGGQAAP